MGELLGWGLHETPGWGAGEVLGTYPPASVIPCNPIGTHGMTPVG